MSQAEKIKINVRGAESVPYLKLVNLQGDLKILTDHAYQNFKSNIRKNGFIEPISVWIDPDGKMKILNGHQRLATVKRMVEKEDYQVDDLPISIVEAENYEDAKLKLLALTSEYGEMSQDGLVNFLSDMSLKTDEIQKYLTDTANLKHVDIEGVMTQLRDLKVDIAMPDALDVGNIIVGSETAPMSDLPPMKAAKNDSMSGLRLVQVFLTDDQLGNFRKQIDAIMKTYSLDNLTEAILMAVSIVSEEAADEEHPDHDTKKSKK